MLPFLRSLNAFLVSLALFLGSFTGGVMFQTWRHGGLSFSLPLSPSPTVTPTLTPNPTSTPTPSPSPLPSPTLRIGESASPPQPITPRPTTPPLPQSISMPGEGFTKTRVVTDVGTFTLSCVGAAKGSVRVVTDSGNDNDCQSDCSVLSLADYAARNGAFAAMNGMYFCPADYAACSDKKNSFDTLFFNSRSKTYLNSDNNVYSVWSPTGKPVAPLGTVLGRTPRTESLRLRKPFTHG